MEVYAKQANDGELMANATEMRKRAEQRLGELMDEARKGGLLAKPPGGSRRYPRRDRVAKKPDHPTLAEMGIDKNLADRARKTAAMSEARFEKHVAEVVRRAVAVTEGDKKIVAEARAAQQEEKRKHREKRERDLGAKLVALPTKRYGLIYADPPWKFRTFSVVTGMDRSAENHYPTMTVDEIKALPVPAADDCVLFLWATAPMLVEGIEVMAAWGFTYKSNCIWGKDKPGTGYWFRSQHEQLLVGTRGNLPAPAPGTQYSSLQMFPVGRHSEKPFAFMEQIAELFPNLPKLEMFSRQADPITGWDTWGNEAAA
jgi:N6-adenosine-specific RNA methylase IME4